MSILSLSLLFLLCFEMRKEFSHEYQCGLLLAKVFPFLFHEKRSKNAHFSGFESRPSAAPGLAERQLLLVVM